MGKSETSWDQASKVKTAFSDVEKKKTGWNELYAKWTVKYEANELPDGATPAWTKYGDASTIEISPAGYLHVISSALLGGISYEIADVNFLDSIGATVEFRMKVISGQVDDNFNSNGFSYFYVMVTKGDNSWASPWAIYSNAIRAQPSLNQYLMNTTDDYHIYRVTAKDGIAKLYIDGILRFTETTINIGAGGPGFHFGPEENGVAGIETSWDYVYYRTDGAFAPEEERPKALFSNIEKKKTTYTEAGKGISLIVLDPVPVNSSVVLVNNEDCFVNGPIVSYTWPEGKEKTSWT